MLAGPKVTVNQIATLVAWLPDLVVGGAIADATGGFLLLVTSGIALGAALGTLVVLLLDAPALARRPAHRGTRVNSSDVILQRSDAGARSTTGPRTIR